MRVILSLIILLLFYEASNAQIQSIISRPNPNATGVGYKYISSDSGMLIGTFAGKPPLPPARIRQERKAIQVYDSVNHTQWTWKPELNRWDSSTSGGGSNTTIIRNGNGPALFDTTIIYNANGSKLQLDLYTPGKKVTNVTTSDVNGSGFFPNYFTDPNTDTTHINYSVAPNGSIKFILSGIYTDSTIASTGGGGNTGGGGTDTSGNAGSGGTDTSGNVGGGGTDTSGTVGGGGFNSRWTYVTDTSCQVGYGANFALSNSSANMMALANSSLPFVRVPYNGSGAATYPAYTAGGYNVLLSYNTGPPVSGNYTPLPTDTAAFRTTLKNFLNTNGINNLTGVALINEPANIKHGAGYWNPKSAQNVINLIRSGANALHELGLLAYEGGIFSGEIAYYEVWKDYVNRGYSDSAGAFAASVFPAGTNLVNWSTDTAHGYRVRYMDSLIAALPTLPLDGVNIHLGFTIADADSTATSIDMLPFKQMVRYLHRVSGKPVISNELSFQNNSSPDILSQVIDAIQDIHDAKNGDMSMAFLLNIPAHAFANTDGSLTDFGIALQHKLSEQRIDVLQ
jgi:hypothetical protein